ncbi:MAG: YidC/Oxa1 family membrane protein insertase [Halanaerobium sp.]|nr:YidC/Oxa1 family membrane protein insertase [Halanaerobium sp.]
MSLTVTFGLLGFSWLGNFMASALNFFYDFTNDWALAIILITVVIRIILTPLDAKQTKSMKAMQELQPKIEELKKKYKNDQQTMQQKTMELYKENNANPAAGCLPLLIQMPILIALYRAIFDLKEQLIHSKFLWIGTLTGGSLAEPDIALVIITGLVMLGTTYLQQKWMGSSTQQNQMMTYIMPLFIIFIGFRLPSGLILYWVTQNLVMAIQKYFLLRGGS